MQYIPSLFVFEPREWYLLFSTQVIKAGVLRDGEQPCPKTFFSVKFCQVFPGLHEYFLRDVFRVFLRANEYAYKTENCYKIPHYKQLERLCVAREIRLNKLFVGLLLHYGRTMRSLRQHYGFFTFCHTPITLPSVSFMYAYNPILPTFITSEAVAPPAAFIFSKDALMSSTVTAIVGACAKGVRLSMPPFITPTSL